MSPTFEPPDDIILSYQWPLRFGPGTKLGWTRRWELHMTCCCSQYDIKYLRDNRISTFNLSIVICNLNMQSDDMNMKKSHDGTQGRKGPPRISILVWWLVVCTWIAWWWRLMVPGYSPLPDGGLARCTWLLVLGFLWMVSYSHWCRRMILKIDINVYDRRLSIFRMVHRQTPHGFFLQLRTTFL